MLRIARRARLYVSIGLASLALACGADSSDPVAPDLRQSTAGAGMDENAAAMVGFPVETYVGSAECRRCHADEFAKWSGSHHDLAMQVANDETVLANFDAAEFLQGDSSFRFSRRDGKYWVQTENAQGELEEFEIAYTFGVEPLQQYLVRFPHGRFQPLSVAWDTRPASRGGERWFHLYSDDPRKPGDPFHWTGGYQTWNHMCAECHSTNLEKHFDPATDSYQSSWAEIDVACEACHGPGSLHVAGAAPGSEGPVALPVTFATGDSRYEVDACARCHSRRRRVSAEDRTGRPLLDDFLPATLRPGLYHSDGQILDEVYVYGSFAQSAMFARGGACSDCHDPHSLELRATGNALCMQCHTEDGNPRFESLTKKAYDTEEHHFHSAGSAGAQCVNCHMPTQTYMGVDSRRDHSIRVPRPDLTVTLGTPNACTQCHADQSATWAAEAVTTWYGGDRPPHYGEVLARGRQGVPTAGPELAALALDPSQPGIARATALDLLRTYGGGGVGVVEQALLDQDPLVRFGAVRAPDAIPPEQRYQIIYRMLEDSTKLVRTEAARALASVPRDLMPRSQLLENVTMEYITSQLLNSDRPESYINTGALHAARGDLQGAVAALETALYIDPGFAPAYVNLADLMRAQGRETEGERLLRVAIAVGDDDGTARHALGLSLVRQQRSDEALLELRRATEANPLNARFAYVYGVALQSTGQIRPAIAFLEQSFAAHPYDLEILTALVTFNRDAGDLDEAIRYSEMWVAMAPDDARAAEQLADLVLRRGR